MAKEVEVKETEEVEIVPDVNLDMAKSVSDLKNEVEKLRSEVTKNEVDTSKLKHIDVSINKEGDSLNSKMRKFTQEVKKKGINIEGDSSSGNTVSVPTEFAGELAKLLNETGVIRKNAKIVKMNSKSMTVNVLDGSAEATFTSQGANKDGTNDTFRDVTFTRHTLAFIKTVSNELIQDSAFDLSEELLDISSEAFAQAEDKAGFIGTGSPITGLTVVSGTSEVELTGTLAQGTLTYQKIVDLIFAPAGKRTGNEKLYMHRSIWGRVRQLEDSNGNLISLGQNINEPNFEGVPVVFVEDMNQASQDGTNKSLMVYGDLNNVWVATRNEFGMQVSDQATVVLNNGTTVNCFQQNCTAFRFEEAIDIQVVFPSAFGVLRTAH